MKVSDVPPCRSPTVRIARRIPHRAHGATERLGRGSLNLLLEGYQGDCFGLLTAEGRTSLKASGFASVLGVENRGEGSLVGTWGFGLGFGGSEGFRA